jgi:hypothetical protein
MPLNLNKVEKLLYENKFAITSFFVQNGLCKYMKLFSLEYGENLLIYIDPDFEFQISEREAAERNIQIFNLKYIDFKEGTNVIEKYDKYPDQKDIQNKYPDNIQLENKISNNIEEDLENNYNKKIFLNDLEKAQVVDVKDCIRQLKRISLCVQDLQYRLCLVKDTYFCVMENEDEYNCYLLKDQKTEGLKMFFVVIELEIFYEKLQHVNIDVNYIKTGIYKILDKNQSTNYSNLLLLFEKYNYMDEILHRVNDKKSEYLQCIEKYTNLLKKTYEYEQEIQQEIDKLKEANKNNAINDTSFVHQKSVLENKINSTRDVKQKILKNLTNIKQLCDNIYLKTDKSEFDSAIMINALIKNISELNSVI